MELHEAKKEVKSKLELAGLPYTRISAKTWDFTDLARAKFVSVTVHGSRQWNAEQWKVFQGTFPKSGKGYGVSGE